MKRLEQDLAKNGFAVFIFYFRASSLAQPGKNIHLANP